MKKVTIISVVTALALAGLWVADTVGAKGGRAGSDVAIYVWSQDLVYDSIIGPDLPNKGSFQKLEDGGPTGHQTEFGPGDPGYLGGRWWVDVNGDGERDEGDKFFSCPLLGPGRSL